MSRRSSARSTSCSGRSIADRSPAAASIRLGAKHMTETLAEKTCSPCRGGVPPLGRDEALRFQAQAPDWELRDEARRIERTFRFRDFREALAFVQQVGEIAESEGHHPDISFGWGYATVSLSTKKIKGLHHRLPEHQEDQGIARERLHHGEQDRPHARSAGLAPG